MSLDSGLTSEIQKLAPDAVIELFELDCTAIGGELLRFHAGTNQLMQNLVWDGNEYQRYPVKVEGFEHNGQGQFPRPKLSVSNVLSAITVLLMQYDNLTGAKLTRRRTFVKYLDAENFVGGVNATEDPTVEFTPDVYFVDRKSGETRDFVELELAAACDVAGTQIPRRQITQNVCPWVYRGSECGFAGPPVYDKNDQRITSAASSEGQAVLSTYNAYLAAKVDLEIKESALTAAVIARAAACTYQRISSTYTPNSLAAGAPPDLDDGVYYNPFTRTYKAFSGGSEVSLGATYVIGAYQLDFWNNYVSFPIYAIEVWGVPGTCSAADSAYTAALSARDSSKSAYDTAVTNYQNALDDLPDDDDIYAQEKCGKRLSSCKLRFGDNAELPFGGFPSAGLFR